MMSEEEILGGVLQEFQGISAIPRKSGHEEAVSRYLYERFQALGLRAVRDAAGNVIAEKKASPGCEIAALTILQAHMDMVCVAAEGADYDPLRDAVKLKREGNFLSAEATSLGADDGIDVAVILYLMQADFPHGPLRAVFTVDEEDGMSGAAALDEKYLQAAYLLNCDSESLDVLTVGSAGNVSLDFSREIHWQPCPQEKNAFSLSFSGLLGGHSGTEIHCGHANAIKLAAKLLDRLDAAGVLYSLADFHGGKAQNSIPANAEALLVVPEEQTAQFQQEIEAMRGYLKTVYGSVEKEGALLCRPAKLPRIVLDAADKDALLRLLCLLHSGVYALRPQENLVESSANIGLLDMTDEKIRLRFMPRSLRDEVIEDFKRLARHQAESAGFISAASSQSPGWPLKEQGTLAALVQAAFFETVGRAMRVDCVHAGLECSWFHKKNPRLEMVSIGPTIDAIHSPQEKLHLDTLVLYTRVIVNFLRALARPRQ